jgi:hypothetical protein
MRTGDSGPTNQNQENAEAFWIIQLRKKNYSCPLLSFFLFLRSYIIQGTPVPYDIVNSKFLIVNLKSALHSTRHYFFFV